MLAQPSAPNNVAAREAALRKISEGYRLLSEGHAELALCPEPQPIVAAPAPEGEVLLRPEDAARLFAAKSTRTVIRFAKRHPEVVRHAGRRVFYERGALLRAMRKG